MPHHSLLSCFIEIGESTTRLREYGTTYQDRTCETYVAIPSKPTPFSIRLSSDSYVAPGLAVYVFIDSIYQTNRNRRGATPQNGKLEFHLGMKEDLLKDGRVIARGWWFEKLNIGESNVRVNAATPRSSPALVEEKAKPIVNDNVLENLGLIEVVVLRCEEDPASTPIDPWSFPQLPSTHKYEHQSSHAAKEGVPKIGKGGKEAKLDYTAGEDDGGGSLGGMMAMFGVDGQYDMNQRQASTAQGTRYERYCQRDRGFRDIATSTSSGDSNQQYHNEIREALTGALRESHLGRQSHVARVASPASITKYENIGHRHLRDSLPENYGQRHETCKNFDYVRGTGHLESPAQPYLFRNGREEDQRGRRRSRKYERAISNRYNVSTPQGPNMISSEGICGYGPISEHSSDVDSNVTHIQRYGRRYSRRKKHSGHRHKPERRYAHVDVPLPYAQVGAVYTAENSAKGVLRQRRHSAPVSQQHPPLWQIPTLVHDPAAQAFVPGTDLQAPASRYFPGDYKHHPNWQPAAQLGYRSYDDVWCRHAEPALHQAPTFPYQQYTQDIHTTEKIIELEEQLQRLKAGNLSPTRPEQPRQTYQPWMHTSMLPYIPPWQYRRPRKKGEKHRSRSSSPGWAAASSVSETKASGDSKSIDVQRNKDQNGVNNGIADKNSNKDGKKETVEEASKIDNTKDNKYGGFPFNSDAQPDNIQYSNGWSELNADHDKNKESDGNNGGPENNWGGNNNTNDASNGNYSWGNPQNGIDVQKTNATSNGCDKAGPENGFRDKKRHKDTKADGRKKTENKGKRNKTRGDHGRNLSSTSSSEEEKPYTRSYWASQVSSGRRRADANSSRKRDHHTMPEDPIYTVSKTEAEAKHLRHQVRGGKGAEQQRKKGAKPLYWDNFAAPYAVFRFKYRSGDMLRKIIGEDIKENESEYREWLKTLTKEQLIAEMLQRKDEGGSEADADADTDTDDDPDEEGAGGQKVQAGENWAAQGNNKSASSSKTPGGNGGGGGAIGSWDTSRGDAGAFDPNLGTSWNNNGNAGGVEVEGIW